MGKKYAYNDNTFIGTGAIECAACGRPTREHKLTELCPAMGDERVTVARPRDQKRARSNITEAERAGE